MPAGMSLVRGEVSSAEAVSTGGKAVDHGDTAAPGKEAERKRQVRETFLMGFPCGLPLEQAPRKNEPPAVGTGSEERNLYEDSSVTTTSAAVVR